MLESSKTSPIIKEFKESVQGVTRGDFGKAVVNNGLLALYVVSVGGIATNSQAKVGL